MNNSYLHNAAQAAFPQSRFKQARSEDEVKEQSSLQGQGTASLAGLGRAQRHPSVTPT